MISSRFALTTIVLVAATAVAPVRGQRGQAPAPAAAAAPAPERFTVQSDGHPIAVWARRPPTPRGSVVLVHGRTWSSRPDFDLQVPGLQRSVMMSLAAQGFAAYAADMRGYGETPRDSTGFLTPKRAAADIVNVVTWVGQQHATLPKPVLIGWSRGAAQAELAAQSAPTKMSALVLFGFVFDPDLQFADTEAPEKPALLKNTAENAISDFLSPKITPPIVVQAFIEQAMKADPVMADLKNDTEFNGLKPDRVSVPTLVLFGENDPGVVAADAGKFFAHLGTPDKQMVQLPGADHCAHLEDTHEAWIAAVVNFINRPPARR
ncbi:MAG TPA: alpha/beta hydrolase [Vicinamibacterales bacterium]|nr:alpha/beta hydrolase [Vicinamibacterales bacterium]